MPPNSTVTEDNDKSICVSDSFHFSSFYWKESSASLAGMGMATGADGDDDSIAGAGIRSISETIDGEIPTADQAVMKVCPLLYDVALLIVLYIMRAFLHHLHRSRLTELHSHLEQPFTVANPDRVKLKFYSNVLGDNSSFIHYGKWDGLDLEQPGAYGRASEAMTDYMYRLSLGLLPHRAEANDFCYVDLGSGTGGKYIIWL